MFFFLQEPLSACRESNPVNQQDRMWGWGSGGWGVEGLQPLSYVLPLAEPSLVRPPLILALSLSLCLQCAELQCYILPLAAILNKLRAGRYRDRKWRRFHTLRRRNPCPAGLLLSPLAGTIEGQQKRRRLLKPVRHAVSGVWEYRVATSISCVCARAGPGFTRGEASLSCSPA